MFPPSELDRIQMITAWLMAREAHDKRLCSTSQELWQQAMQLDKHLMAEYREAEAALLQMPASDPEAKSHEARGQRKRELRMLWEQTVSKFLPELTGRAKSTAAVASRRGPTTPPSAPR